MYPTMKEKYIGICGRDAVVTHSDEWREPTRVTWLRIMDKPEQSRNNLTRSLPAFASCFT